MGFFKEFKEFAVRGNMVDMAVGIVIGAAFGKIVSSLVDNILMPVIGSLTGGIDLAALVVSVGEVNIEYGVFLQNIVDFIIVAFSVFLVVKAINRANRKKAEVPAAPPAPSKEETLLTEIRDLLRSKK